MVIPRYYVFYAEASFLTAHVDGPTAHTIPEQGFQRLSIYGGNQASPQTGFNEAGLVSVGKGYTNVSGNATANGWTTTTTSVAENLNIAGGAITADQVTAQITTNYPSVGNVPSVSFQGTQFVNLKVQGKPIVPTLNLNICSPKPPNDLPYVDDPQLLLRAEAEFQNIVASGAPPDVGGQFANWSALTIQSRGKVDCSLVTTVPNLVGQAFGHVIVVPKVGNIYLAELGVGNHIELTMIRADLTSRGKTQIKAVMADTQGHGMP